jgi:hypothetical protein
MLVHIINIKKKPKIGQSFTVMLLIFILTQITIHSNVHFAKFHHRSSSFSLAPLWFKDFIFFQLGPQEFLLGCSGFFFILFEFHVISFPGYCRLFWHCMPCRFYMGSFEIIVKKQNSKNRDQNWRWHKLKAFFILTVKKCM